jgi:L-2,4-diaminobutyrate transaminase
LTQLNPDLAVAEADRQNVFHPFTVLGKHEVQGPRRVIVRGEGVRVFDSEGRSYIDGMAGLWCVNVGYGRDEIADAMRAQAERLHYYPAFSSMATEAPALLAERLLAAAPPEMSKVFFGLSGSDANDTQLKLVRLYNNLLDRPEKKKVIARFRSYHGVGLGSGSMTGLPTVHENFDMPIGGILHTRSPYPFWESHPGEDDDAFSERLARELDELIIAEGPDTVAAFIAEPVQTSGGVIVPPSQYFRAVKRVLDKYDILLIADEVVCGFGRLGTWFGGEVFGMEPDLISVAKGMTSAYAALSGTIVSERVWRVLADESGGRVFGHGYTYSAHPVAAAAALANLDIIEREDLHQRALTAGDALRAGLRDALAGHPFVGEIRGIGLLAAVEFVVERDPPQRFSPVGSFGAQVTQEALERGLITRTLQDSDTIAFTPPLTITDAEIAETVEIVRDAVGAAAI